MMIAAGTGAVGVDATAYLAQFGIIGFSVVILALVVRYLFTRLESQAELRVADYQRLADQRMEELRHGHDIAIQTLSAQIVALNEDKRTLQRSNDEAVIFMRDKLVPALADSARIMADFAAVRRSP